MLLKLFMYVAETFSQILNVGVVDKIIFEYLVGIFMPKSIKKHQNRCSGEKLNEKSKWRKQEFK